MHLHSCALIHHIYYFFIALLAFCIFYIEANSILPITTSFSLIYNTMISHRLQSVPITGYYHYLSQNRHRVNVAPYTGVDNKETMTKTTTTASNTSSSNVAMNNSNKPLTVNPSFVDNMEPSSSNPIDKDITKWSSTDVQHWIEEQCQKFELKKATSEKFQMNGTLILIIFFMCSCCR